MLPSRYVAMDALPLNANGKVDRERLPKPAHTRPSLAVDYVPPRDLAQRRLAELWEQCLGIRPVGVDDDFFELGGDSLTAATMLADAGTLVGRAIPPSMLLASPTVARLARAIASDRDDLAVPVVPVRATGSEPPLFFLHGDYHSGGLYCREIARHLDPAWPLYAVPPLGYDGRAIPPSYGEAAAAHVAAIRAVQPRGPYHLGGLCNGGLVALEIARQLRAAGDDVATLVLVGASADNVRYRALSALVEVGGRLAGMHVAARRYAYRRLRDYAQSVGGVRGADRWRFVLGKLGVARAEAVRLMRTRRHAGDASLDPGAREPGPHGHRTRIRAHYLNLESEYVPRPYRGRATLLWPCDDPTPVDVAARAWRRVVAELDVVSVPGNHHTCITRHVDALAGTLASALAQSGRAARAAHKTPPP
jgi:thioesterase domain-containing protein